MPTPKHLFKNQWMSVTIEVSNFFFNYFDEEVDGDPGFAVNKLGGEVFCRGDQVGSCNGHRNGFTADVSKLVCVTPLTALGNLC